jgi:endoglucanase
MSNLRKLAFLPLLLAVCGLWTAAAVGQTAPAAGAAPVSMAPAVTLPAGFVTLDAFEQERQMGRGVNIIGYDPIWDNFSKGRFSEKLFAKIHEGGFQTLRVNLQAFRHMDKDNKLNPSWFRLTDWVVANAVANHETVILDEHDYEACAKDLTTCRTKVLAFWSQVAEHYKDTPNAVLFEILNEPNGQVSPAEWNSLLHDALQIIRKTNPTRNVVIGPAMWNSIGELKDLQLPADDGHIIVTFHYYNPFTFTHQGAYWSPGTVKLSGIKWGTPEEKLAMEKEFDGVKQWSLEHQRPILLGEFGAYEKGDMESRVRWTTYMRQTAESRGFAWTYWQFDSDFIVYNIEKDEWNTPIYKALIP